MNSRELAVREASLSLSLSLSASHLKFYRDATCTFNYCNPAIVRCSQAPAIVRIYGKPPLLLHSLKRAKLPNDNDDNDDNDDDDLFLSDASYVRANIVISLFLLFHWSLPCAPRFCLFPCRVARSFCARAPVFLH